MATQTFAEALAILNESRRPFSDRYWRGGFIYSGDNVAWIEDYYGCGCTGSTKYICIWNGLEIREVSAYNANSYTPYFDVNYAPQIRMSGNNILWYGINNNLDWSLQKIQLFWWNGTSIIQLSDAANPNPVPQMSGNNMVWQASDGNDTEIYFWNGNTIVQLTNNATNDFAPQISENTVTWQNADSKSYSVTVKNGGFFGTSATDIINAQDGDDVVTSNLTSLQQNDKIDGGTGSDTFILTLGDFNSNIVINAGNLNNQITNINTAVISNFEKFDLARFLGTVNFNGSTGNDWIKSGRGNDLLNGGLGADQLIGGLGNDTYILDSISDVVTENPNEGKDFVQSTVNTTLTNNVEDLTLLGTTNINGTGNNSDNTITGNSGNNLLKGLNGNDTLLGAAGNDTLVGGAGSDRLTGGDGLDQFLFGSGVAFNPINFGVNTITDFAKGSDKIALSKASFTSLVTALNSGLQSTEFALINSAVNELILAGSSSAKVVYNQATGNLFYNPDAAIAGLTGGGQFAFLSNQPSLSATDFLVQA